MKSFKALIEKMKGTTPPDPKTETFEEWFDRQGFRNFTGAEVARYFTRRSHGVSNTYPPRLIWKNIVPTMRVVDDLRDAINCPIRLTSSYRSQQYNQAVGGAPLSQHRHFRALDIQADGATPHEVFKLLEAWRDAGKFKGGLGIYPTFVHIDTRGKNATW